MSIMDLFKRKRKHMRIYHSYKKPTEYKEIESVLNSRTDIKIIRNIFWELYDLQEKNIKKVKITIEGST